MPTTSLPTVALGSDVLFQVIEPKTRPIFTTQFTVDGTCQMPGNGGGSFCGGSATANSAGKSGELADAGIAVRPIVDVSFQGNIGPYETVVLRSDDATELERWLTDHGYFVSPDASKIIAAYVAAGAGEFGEFWPVVKLTEHFLSDMTQHKRSHRLTESNFETRPRWLDCAKIALALRASARGQECQKTEGDEARRPYCCSLGVY